MSGVLLTVTVHPDKGESYRVEVNSRLLLAWEKTHGGSALSVLEDASIASMYQLTHFAAQTRHAYTGTLAEFESSVDIEPEDPGTGDEGLRPTHAAPSTEPPSSLPAPQGRTRKSG